MSKNRVFKFSYHLTETGQRKAKLHKQRDGDAFTELMAILTTLDYTYEDLILNIPPDKPPKNRYRFDLSFLKPTDLIVLPSRPPLHDDATKRIKKRMTPSYSSLEGKIFWALRPYFKVSNRSNIKLSRSISRRLRPGYENRADITFRQALGTNYKEYKAYDAIETEKPDLPQRTAAYLVIPKKRNASDPRILNCFGMGGTETLIWAYLLRRQYWQELEINLDAPRFVMVELFTEPIPDRPTSLSFANSWRVEPVLNIPL